MERTFNIDALRHIASRKTVADEINELRDRIAYVERCLRDSHWRADEDSSGDNEDAGRLDQHPPL
jgi:hypothetical protein